jgi:hypothetical protein
MCFRTSTKITAVDNKARNALRHLRALKISELETGVEDRNSEDNEREKYPWTRIIIY